jgi:hypothetical protein
MISSKIGNAQVENLNLRRSAVKDRKDMASKSGDFD